jgi:chromosome segregation ATPase
MAVRYEDLKTGGFLDLEPEEEDNTDLLMQIQEEEELCAFYESQLQQLEEQCAEKGRATDVADDSLEKALEEWMQSVKSFLAQMDELKAAILPTDASADDFSLSAVYKRMREIAKEITEKSKAHRDMVTGTVTHNDHLPGWQFEIIPEEN